jgi:hypothetical protein
LAVAVVEVAWAKMAGLLVVLVTAQTLALAVTVVQVAVEELLEVAVLPQQVKVTQVRRVEI